MLHINKNKKIIIFIIVGVTSVCIDWTTYLAFLFFLNIEMNLSKALSFCIGAIFSYFANKYWTFNSQRKNLIAVPKFILVYLCALFLNVFVNDISSLIFSEFEYVILIAFFFATILSAIFNYLGLNLWVFKKEDK